MHNSGESLIMSLIEKARARPFEVRRVQGQVTECHTLLDGDKKIFAVHIKNGTLSESFWLADQPDNEAFHPPMTGDWVKGVINTFDDKIDFADQSLKPVFDFENQTGQNEESHFAWFREQERLARSGNPNVSPVYIKNWKP
jgi:hypothetical protein